MKIQYLNPENAPTPPDGWRWKTALCKPETIHDWRVWRPKEASYSKPNRSGTTPEWTYITQADLPWDYFFDLDGTGLSFDDLFYRRGVERAAKEGKTIQAQNHGFGVEWGIVPESSSGIYFSWGIFNYRIHPRHAAEYGLPLVKIEEMLQREGFGSAIYAELVPDAPTEQPDLDSPDYWRGKQDEVRLQWAQNPEIKRDMWNIFGKSWVQLSGDDLGIWNRICIYRPRTVALTPEQVDEKDFKEWVKAKGGLPNFSFSPSLDAFLAGRRTLREKGGAM